MKSPWKIVLPALIGSISALLMVWDIHDQKVIMSVGMAWDTGAPLWPYQTPDILLFAINFPVYLLSTGTAQSLGLYGALRYIVFYPAILVWWFFVGSYFDKARQTTNFRKRPLAAVSMCVAAVVLLILGAHELSWTFHWWWTYSRTIISVTDLILLRGLTPTIWCFLFAFIAVRGASRRIWVRDVR